MLTIRKAESKMDTVALVRRDQSYDAYIDGKKIGSGPWGYVYTAYYFYRAEGMEVKIYE